MNPFRDRFALAPLTSVRYLAAGRASKRNPDVGATFGVGKMFRTAVLSVSYILEIGIAAHVPDGTIS